MKTIIDLSGIKGKSVADCFALIGWQVVDRTIGKPPITYCKIDVDSGVPVLVLYHQEMKPEGFVKKLLNMMRGKDMNAAEAWDGVGRLNKKDGVGIAKTVADEGVGFV